MSIFKLFGIYKRKRNYFQDGYNYAKKAYEYHIFGFDIRICHLKGEHWRFKPWRRISIKRVKS